VTIFPIVLSCDLRAVGENTGSGSRKGGSRERLAGVASRTPHHHATGVVTDTSRAWQHPWLRIERLIRSILEVRRDEVMRPVMKATLVEALKEREKIRRAGWWN